MSLLGLVLRRRDKGPRDARMKSNQSAVAPEGPPR